MNLSLDPATIYALPDRNAQSSDGCALPITLCFIIAFICPGSFSGFGEVAKRLKSAARLTISVNDSTYRVELDR